MVDVRTVKRIAMSLPEAYDGSSPVSLQFSVRGKLSSSDWTKWTLASYGNCSPTHGGARRHEPWSRSSTPAADIKVHSTVRMLWGGSVPNPTTVVQLWGS